MRRSLFLALCLVPLASPAQGPPIYCQPATTDSTVAGDYIGGVQLADLLDPGIDTAGGPGYEDLRFQGPAYATRLQPGASYSLDLVMGDRAGTDYAAWIDLDQDLSFGTDERLGDLTSSGPASTGSIAFTVPTEAARGYTTLRVRCAYQAGAVDPCAAYTYGATKDLLVVIDDGGPCIPLITYGNVGGEQIAGITLNTFSRAQTVPDPMPYSDDRSLGAMLSIGIFYNLSLTLGPASGQLAAAWIDWNNDRDWDDAGELVGQGFAPDPAQTLVFSFTVPNGAPQGQHLLRARVWDSGLPPSACADRLSGETEDYTVGLRHPNFLCFPVAGGTQAGDEIVSFTLQGHTFSAPAAWPYHTVHDTVPLHFERGGAYTLELTSGTHASTRFQVWVDLNYDGDFNDAGEALASTLSTTPGQSITLPFTLPAGMDPGETYLRLRCSDGGSAAPTSCANTTTGEIEDVAVVIEDASGPCIPFTRTWTQQGHYIDGVSLGSITNNATGAIRGRAYQDLRAQSTLLDAGSTYDLLLTAGTATDQAFDLFIDLDQDGDLTLPDEHMGRVVTALPGEQATLTFTVPALVQPGPTLLRVRCSDADTLFNGCADLPLGTGETEDYTAVLNSTTALDVEVGASFNVVPLPAEGVVEVRTPAALQGRTLVVVDALGHVLHQGTVRATRTLIPAQHWAAGTYVVRIAGNDIRKAERFMWP